jgi:hypothetical protein
MHSDPRVDQVITQLSKYPFLVDRGRLRAAAQTHPPLPSTLGLGNGCGDWLRRGDTMTDLITVHRTHDGSPLLLNREHIVWAEDIPNGSNVRLVTGETIGIKEPITQLKNK